MVRRSFLNLSGVTVETGDTLNGIHSIMTISGLSNKCIIKVHITRRLVYISLMSL